MDSLTREHVPPLQFFPKALRAEVNPNLQTVPSHLRCNAASRKDEEYFYHGIAVHVAGSHPRMGPILFNDLKRRQHRPQTPAMIRRILANAGTTTRGGIILPAPLVEVSLDLCRLEQVALKVAQCIYYLDCGAYLPKALCKDIRPCVRLEAVPEWYKLSWGLGEFKGEYPDVFHYCCVDFPPEDLVLISMLFWESFLFCMTFESPSSSQPPVDS